MTDEYFLNLDIDCTILDDVKEFLDRAIWVWVPYMLLAFNFPEKLTTKDYFLDEISSVFDGRLRLYKIPKNSVYNWHQDYNVGCSLNLVMEEYNCHTLFSTKTHSYKTTEGHPIIHDVVELKYVVGKYTLFNNQKTHQVVNLDDRDRYLLTMTFPKDVTYDRVRSWYESR
jgi:hypothetical protein